VSRSWFGRRGAGSVSPGGDPPGSPRTPLAPYPPGPGPSEPSLTIDALGRKCPIPIIMLAEQIRDVPVGQIIAVLADDPAAYTDVPAWCGMKSHEFVFRSELPSGWAFGIRRRY
jgi:tRNA 2-thiouridine synthesizing protein A